jgi:hypothetical protein
VAVAVTVVFPNPSGEKSRGENVRACGGFRIGLVYFRYNVVGASEKGFDVQVMARTLNRRHGLIGTWVEYFHNVPDLKTLKKLVAQRYGLV